MAISKDKKREIVAKLNDAFSEASAVTFVGFTKLTVAVSSKMRKELANSDVQLYVAKKTLIRKALENRGYTGSLPELPGEVAVAWNHIRVGGPYADDTAPSRTVYEFGKKLKGMLTLLGGVFDGAFVDAAQMTAIATIPPMPVLRGMFVNVLNSPIQGFVVALDKIREQKA